MDKPPVDDVRLPDLEVIRRYSIAVKREHAPVAEVIAALRADLERLSGTRRSVKAAEEAPVRRPAAPKAPARRAPAKPAPKVTRRST